MNEVRRQGDLPRHRAVARAAAHRFGRAPAPRRSLAFAGGAALAVFGLLAFVAPGFLVTKVFDEQALREGVRAVLERDFHLIRVTEVECPREQRVSPGGRFVCTARINGSSSVVPIEVRDRAGHYAVSRPS
jgi:hypothetical protein